MRKRDKPVGKTRKDKISENGCDAESERKTKTSLIRGFRGEIKKDEKVQTELFR